MQGLKNLSLSKKALSLTEVKQVDHPKTQEIYGIDLKVKLKSMKI